MSLMGKLDPIVSEFETEEEAEAYDKWFRERVQHAIDSVQPRIPHEQVMKRARAIIERKRRASLVWSAEPARRLSTPITC